MTGNITNHGITNHGILSFGGQTHISESAIGPGAQVVIGRPAKTGDARRAEIGVITVLSQEAQAVREVFGLSPVNTGGLPFMEGSLNVRGRTLRIAGFRALEMGPRSTTIAFDHLRRHYSPEVIVLAGIGGGIHNDMAIGDVVITGQVVYYDQRRETPAGARRRGTAAQAPAAIGHALNSFFSDHGEPAVLEDETQGRYRVHTGPIGSGDAVITDSDSPIVHFLEHFNEHILAVEMEGAGLSQAFHEQNGGTAVRGWVIVRGISDDASEHRNTKRTLAARRAALALRQLLPYLPVDET